MHFLFFINLTPVKKQFMFHVYSHVYVLFLNCISFLCFKVNFKTLKAFSNRHFRIKPDKTMKHNCTKNVINFAFRIFLKLSKSILQLF